MRSLTLSRFSQDSYPPFNANSGSLSSRFNECSQSSLNSRDQSDTRASTRLTRVSLSPLVLAHELRLWTGLAVYSARGHSIASVILFPVSPGILRTRLPSKERSIHDSLCERSCISVTPALPVCAGQTRSAFRTLPHVASVISFTATLYGCNGGMRES